MSLFGPAEVELVRDAVARAFDGVQAGSAPRPLAMQASLVVLRATSAGRELLVSPRLSRGRSQRVEGALVMAEVGDVPFELSVTGKRLLGSWLDDVDLGDPALRHALDVGATSPELARVVLDERARAQLLTTFEAMPLIERGTTTFLLVTGGWIAWFVPMRRIEGGLLSPAVPMTPDELRAAATACLAATDRLRAAFAAADAAWIERQRAVVTRARARRKRSYRRILVALLVGVVVLVGLCAAASMALLAWSAAPHR